MQAQDKVVQELHEAHALEEALASTLTAHIAVTPRGEYRDLLERHLGETRDQAARLQERLSDLGASQNPIAVAYGLLQTAAGQLFALGKTPLDLLRGTSPDDKLLKNAKDEIASEAYEIATYDGLEALANEVGDAKTATLAREHRTQEEVFLKELREMIPRLTEAVVRTDIEGESTFDPSTIGAADAARDAVREVKTRAKKVRAEAEETAGEAAAAGRAAARDAQEAAKGTARKARARAEKAVDDAEERVEGAAKQAAKSAREQARKTPGVRAVEGEAEGAAKDASELPIAGYESLTVDQVLPKLDALSPTELAEIDGYEREHRARKRVLTKVRELREGAKAGAAS